MNYFVFKAHLTAVELDAAQKALIKAYRQRALDTDEHQQRWDLLTDEMQKLNAIVERRSSLAIAY